MLCRYAVRRSFLAVDVRSGPGRLSLILGGVCLVFDSVLQRYRLLTHLRLAQNVVAELRALLLQGCEASQDALCIACLGSLLHRR